MIECSKVRSFAPRRRCSGSKRFRAPGKRKPQARSLNVSSIKIRGARSSIERGHSSFNKISGDQAMKIRQLSFWAAVVVVGCNGKLTVPDDPNAAGAAGEGGEIGVAGHGDIGVAGDRPTGAGGHGGEVGVAGAHPVDSGGHGNSVAGSGGMGVAGRDFGTGGWNASGGSTPAEGGWGNNGGTGPSGGSGPGPAPGTLGQPCIPGGLVTEAEGSPAKTQIKNLPRCYEGLSCNLDSKCVPTPDCPQNEALCVVRHAALGSGSGGAGGSYDQGSAGWDSAGGSSPVGSNGGA